MLLLGEEAATGNVAVCPCCRWKEHCKDGRCLPAAGMAVVKTARGQPLRAAVWACGRGWVRCAVTVGLF